MRTKWTPTELSVRIKGAYGQAVVAAIQSPTIIDADSGDNERVTGGMRTLASVVERRCQRTERAGDPGAKIRASAGMNASRLSISGSASQSLAFANAVEKRRSIAVNVGPFGR